MSTFDERRRGQEAGRQSPSKGEQRQPREPLFPTGEEQATRPRRTPPAPLADLLGDIDDMLPGRPVAPRPAPPRRVEPPAQPTPPPVARQPEPRQRQSAPTPRREAGTRQTIAVPARPTVEAQRPRQELRNTSVLADMLAEPLPPIEAARARYESLEGDLARIQLAEARPRLSVRSVSLAPPATFSLSQGTILTIVCLASLLVIITLGGGSSGALSAWAPFQQAATGELQQNLSAAVARPAGDYTLKAPPSVTPQQIDQILQQYNSPAVGSGQDWYNLGLKYGIDPAFAVAFFIHESSAGSNPNWAGIKPDGSTTHNVGNIICAGYPTCFGRFRDYSSWEQGIEDWYRLIDVEYIEGRGHRTVADIIPVYAPSIENDVQGYINAVNRLVDQWRSQGVR